MPQPVTHQMTSTKVKQALLLRSAQAGLHPVKNERTAWGQGVQ